MQSREGNKDWIVGNPGRIAQTAALWVGSIGLLVLGLQPILLGALLDDKRVSFDQLALAATAEILAIGVGSILAAFLVSGTAIKAKSAAFLALTALFDHLTAAAASPLEIIVYRGLAGLAEGALVAFAVELIARSRYPGRYGGFFVSLQTIAQSILAIILALFVVGRYGSAGGFETLMVVSLLSLVAAFLLPENYGALPKPENAAQSGLLRLRPVLALFGIFLFYMFLGALWAFLEPLGGEGGISSGAVGVIVSASLGAQVIGALIATVVESRLAFRPILIIAGLLSAAIAVAFGLKPSLGVFWVLSMATGFIWLFVVPFQIRLAVEADEARGAALLVPAAQLIGAALGPVGASLFAGEGAVTPVAWFAAVCALASSLVIFLFTLTPVVVSKSVGVK